MACAYAHQVTRDAAGAFPDGVARMTPGVLASHCLQKN